MVTLTFNLSDAHAARLVDALCGLYGYNPNGEVTRAAFAKKKVAELMRDQVLRFEVSEARKQASEEIEEITVE